MQTLDLVSMSSFGVKRLQQMNTVLKLQRTLHMMSPIGAAHLVTTSSKTDAHVVQFNLFKCSNCSLLVNVLL